MIEKRALVLSGGGSRAAYHVGALKMLAQHGVRYDIYAGTSAGALTAAYIAQWPRHELATAVVQLEKLVRSMKPRDVYRKRFPWWGRPSLLSSAPLANFITKHIDFRLVRYTSVLRVVATDLHTGKARVYTGRDTDQDLAEGVLASSSIPGVFPPVNGRYVDGALVANAPLSPAIKAGATHIDIVSTTPEELDRENPQGLFRYVRRALEISLHSLLEQDLDTAEAINQLVVAGQVEDKRYLTIRVLRPPYALEGGLLDFDPATVDHLIERGEHDAALLV